MTIVSFLWITAIANDHTVHTKLTTGIWKCSNTARNISQLGQETQAVTGRSNHHS